MLLVSLRCFDRRLLIYILFCWQHFVSYNNESKYLPKITPIDRRIMKGLLLPKLDLHRSERDPMIGVRKNPINGDKHQISVMCSWSTPKMKYNTSKLINFSMFLIYRIWLVWFYVISYRFISYLNIKLPFSIVFKNIKFSLFL